MSRLVSAPNIFERYEAGAFLEALRSPWYSLVADLHDTVMRATSDHAASHGLKNLWLPLTTRTITCPTALGSDTEAVKVTVNGVDTYLADSMQFPLEYGCRLAPRGCYTIMPSFRAEKPDQTHLDQFTHSEAEIVGGLDDLIRYVDGYVRALAAAVLDEHGDRLAVSRGGVAHLERMIAHTGGFERLTLDEAVRVVGDVDGCVRYDEQGRSLTREGERVLMARVSEFVWVHDLDLLTVPFYQAFGADERTALAADLFFGLGEIVGSGERHQDPDGLRRSMRLHNVREEEYDWYTRLRQDAPLRTAGFGMGIERFLMWVLDHDDIRDLPLISRVNEPKRWPESVTRP